MEERVLAFNILRRIKDEKICVSNIKNKFNDKEQIIINYLYLDGSIYNYYDKELSKEILSLSIKGKQLLFAHEKEKEILEFENLLELEGYNTEYLSDFMKTRNLDAELDKIFLLEDYDAFTKYTKRLQNPKVTQRLIRMKKEERE